MTTRPCSPPKGGEVVGQHHAKDQAEDGWVEGLSSDERDLDIGQVRLAERRAARTGDDDQQGDVQCGYHQREATVELSDLRERK